VAMRAVRGDPAHLPRGHRAGRPAPGSRDDPAAGDGPHFGKVLDVAMLVLTGGRERTEAEYAGLFEAGATG
jgi:hypothetical protein